MPALFLAGFQSLPPLPTSKSGPSGAFSWVGGFVHILGPCGSLQQTLLWGWEFPLLLQTPQVFIARSIEALFPCTGTLGCAVFLTPHLFLLVYPHANVGPPSQPVTPSQSFLSAPATSLLPSYQSGWMFLLQVLGVRFPYSLMLGQFWLFFLFLNWLLSFFWLCEEVKHIYLLLQIGPKLLFHDF